MTISSSNSSLGLVDAEVPIIVDTKEDVWVMIGRGMGIVTCVVEGKMFLIMATSEVGENSGVEVLEYGK